MESLFKNHFRPSTKLIDSIMILGITPKTIRRLFLDNEVTTTPELIFQLPYTKKLSNHILKTIFNPFSLSIRPSPEYPSFFSTSFSNANGKVEHLHCLMVYEKITPNILELTKETRNHSGFMKFVSNTKQKKEESERFLFTPIVICLKTSSEYVDLFREILGSLYSFLVSVESSISDLRSCLTSFEFITTSMFLINDLIIPPASVQINFTIGVKNIKIPVDYAEKIHYYESNIVVLMDTLDVKNIIKAWESILLGKSLVLLSENNYLIYLILRALESLMFPFSMSQFCMPLCSESNFREVLSSKPIVIGMNSKHLGMSQIVEMDPDLNVLDIDCNNFYSTQELTLCDCIRSELGNKLQYLKAFFYVDSERLHVYRMNALEKWIKDAAFIEKAKDLQMLQSKKRKNHVFCELIREVFFSVFWRSMSDYLKFIIIQSLTGVLEFQTDLFLLELTKCENCTLETFWKELICTKGFKGFIEASEKLDNQVNTKFEVICKKLKNEDCQYHDPDPIFRLELFQKLTPAEMYGKLDELLIKLPRETAVQKFVFLTSLKLLKESLQSLVSSKHESTVPKSPKEILGTLETEYFEGKVFDCPNLFYGDFCIIQMLKGLIYPLSRSDYRNFSTDTNILKKLSNNSPIITEQLSLSLLYYLRTSPKHWNTFVIFDLCKKIERDKSSLLPKYQIAELIEKEMKIDKLQVESLAEGSELMKKIFYSIQKSQESIMVLRESSSEVSLGKKSLVKSKKIYSGRLSERKYSHSPDNSIS